MEGVELDVFRRTFGSIATPVSIVAAVRNGRPVGTTVSSFCALSAAPPLVLVALDRASNTLRVILETQRFSLNVLAATQDHLARACASKGDSKFDEISWTEEAGVPRIERAATWLACEVADELPGGDHVIVTGLIVACAHTAYRPLVYYRRTFCRPAALRRSARA